MDFTLGSVQKFPTGTTVGVYPGSSIMPGSNNAPAASAITSGVMGASSVTFEGLDENTDYVAYAQVSGENRIVRFRTQRPLEGMADVYDAYGNKSPTDIATQAELDAAKQGNPTFDFVNVRDYGAVGDGTTDDLQAFEDAQDAVAAGMGSYSSGSGSSSGRIGVLFVPFGRYYLSDTLHIRRVMTLMGAGGLGWYPATELIFPDGVPGIVVDYYTSSSDGGRGDWSVIRDLGLRALGTSSTSAHAVTFDAKAKIQNFNLRNWGGDGIHIDAGVPTNNANLSQVQDGTIYSCLNGVRVNGNDANACRFASLDCSENRQWGIYDSSFLGNTYVACHASGNGTSGAFGGYKTSGAVNNSAFVGCYSESGQGAADDINQPSIIVAPTSDPGNTGTGMMLRSDTGGHFRSSPIKVLTADGSDSTAYSVLGFRGSSKIAAMFVDPTGEQITLDWDASPYLTFTHNGAAGRRALQISGTTAAEGPGYAKFPRGYFLSEGASRKVTNATSIPASGTWNQGDIVFNTAPTAGGTVGWVCTTGGTPGTWKTFGTIAA